MLAKDAAEGTGDSMAASLGHRRGPPVSGGVTRNRRGVANQTPIRVDFERHHARSARSHRRPLGSGLSPSARVCTLAPLIKRVGPRFRGPTQQGCAASAPPTIGLGLDAAEAYRARPSFSTFFATPTIPAAISTNRPTTCHTFMFNPSFRQDGRRSCLVSPVQWLSRHSIERAAGRSICSGGHVFAHHMWIFCGQVNCDAGKSHVPLGTADAISGIGVCCGLLYPLALLLTSLTSARRVDGLDGSRWRVSGHARLDTCGHRNPAQNWK